MTKATKPLDSDNTLIKFCYALLDDDYGINEKAYVLMREVLTEAFSKEPDFIDLIDATDGRYYIPVRRR